MYCAILLVDFWPITILVTISLLCFTFPMRTAQISSLLVLFFFFKISKIMKSMKTVWRKPRKVFPKRFGALTYGGLEETSTRHRRFFIRDFSFFIDAFFICDFFFIPRLFLFICDFFSSEFFFICDFFSFLSATFFISNFLCAWSFTIVGRGLLCGNLRRHFSSGTFYYSW